MSAPLVGRDREFTQLKEALAQVRQGRGQIVCLIGEAGLGKSRLLEELHKERIQQSAPEVWTLTQGIPYDSSRPYGMFQKMVRNQFGIELEDPPDVIHQKVDTGLRATELSEEAIALCSVATERLIAAKVLHDAPDFAADALKQEIHLPSYEAWRERAAPRSP